MALDDLYRIPVIRKLVNAPKTDAEKQIVAALPPAIVEAAKSKKKGL